MARKLKVFRYSDGFHAWTVAASSRAKALEAWGVRRDLFKDGAAEEIDAGPDMKAALASPGKLIERGLSVDVGEAKPVKAPKAKPSAAEAKARAKVEALEAELAALDETQAQETESLVRRRRALEAEEAEREEAQAKARAALKARLKAAKARLS